MIRLPKDFKEFLQLLNDHHVEYLLVGGYAVGYHGYPRRSAALEVRAWRPLRSGAACLEERGYAILEECSAAPTQEELTFDKFHMV
jgi:hypothetical protein